MYGLYGLYGHVLSGAFSNIQKQYRKHLAFDISGEVHSVYLTYYPIFRGNLIGEHLRIDFILLRLATIPRWASNEIWIVWFQGKKGQHWLLSPKLQAFRVE